MKTNLLNLYVFFITLFYSLSSSANMGDMMEGRCAMCESMGGFGMVFMGVFMIAAVVGLIAIAAYLFKIIKKSSK